VDGKFAAMKEGLPSQVSGFLFFINRNMHPLKYCMRVSKIKRVLGASYNKPSVRIPNIVYSRHTSPHGSEQL
jgi:hypothetical protein